MSGRITGRATVRLDGREYASERGATLNVGGVNRTTKMGGTRVYYNEEPVAPSVQCNVLHTEDMDLIEIGNIRNATVLFECDNGQDYMLTGAFSTAPAELNSSEGTFPLNLSARTCERI